MDEDAEEEAIFRRVGRSSANGRMHGSQISDPKGSRRARLSTMPSLLSSVLLPAAGRTHPFVLLQSSSTQSCLEALRYTLRETISKADGCTVLFALLYSPSILLKQNQPSSDRLQVIDWTSNVPGYVEDDLDLRAAVLEIVQNGVHCTHTFCAAHLQYKIAPPGPLTLVIDSVDSLHSDLGSLSKTEKLLSSLISEVNTRKGPLCLARRLR